MSEENIKALLDQVARVKVDKLLLHGVNLSKDSTFLLTDSLSSLRASFGSIMHVDVSSTGIETEGFHALCEALSALPDMQVLIAKNNALPKEAGLAVAKVLRAGQGLTVLDLSDNLLTDVGVAGICGAILADETDQLDSVSSERQASHDDNNKPIGMGLPLRLQYLGLSSNQITENGLQKLFHAFGEFIKFRQDVQDDEYTLPLAGLNIGFNRIGDEGARKMARFLNMYSDTVKFQQLDLSNTGMTARGVALILSALSTSGKALTTLSIKGNGAVNGHVLHALTRLVLEASDLVSIQTQLSKQHSMELLTDKEAVSAIQQLADAVRHHSGLQHIDFGDMEMTVDAILKGPSSGMRSVSFGASKIVHSVLGALKTIRRTTQRRRNIVDASESHFNTSTSPVSAKTPQSHSPSSSQDHSLAQAASTAGFSRARDEQKKAFRTLSEEVMRLIPALEQLSLDMDKPVSSTHSAVSAQLFDDVSDMDDGDNGGTMSLTRQSVHSNAADFTRSSHTPSLHEPDGFARELALLAAKQALELYRTTGDADDRTKVVAENNSQDIERLSSKVANLSAQMEVIQERLTDVDAWIQRSSDDLFKDLTARVAACERKIGMLETARDDNLVAAESGVVRHDLQHAQHDLATAVSAKVQPMEVKLTGLTTRLLALEEAVESEHETSLHVLTTILSQHTRSMPTSHQNTENYPRSSIELQQHISSMLSATQASHTPSAAVRTHSPFKQDSSPDSDVPDPVHKNVYQR